MNFTDLLNTQFFVFIEYNHYVSTPPLNEWFAASSLCLNWFIQFVAINPPTHTPTPPHPHTPTHSSLARTSWRGVSESNEISHKTTNFSKILQVLFIVWVGCWRFRPTPHDRRCTSSSFNAVIIWHWHGAMCMLHCLVQGFRVFFRIHFQVLLLNACVCWLSVWMRNSYNDTCHKCSK